MKAEFKGIIFDDFTIETNDGEIMDLKKIEQKIDKYDIKYAWSYICKECANKYGFMNIKIEEVDKTVCCVEECVNLKNVVKITLTHPNDIRELHFFNPNDLYNEIRPLTEEDYKVSLDSLNVKLEHTDWYRLNKDNTYKEVIDNKPKYVEFNSVPVPYEIALIKVKNEIYNMFKDCNSYQEARAIMMASDDICSAEKGYSVLDEFTGHLYGDWAFMYGCDDDETINWDVRWY